MTTTNSPSVRTTLIVDAAVEFVVAGVLILGANSVSRWLGLGFTLSLAIGAVFATAGFGIAMLVRQPRPDQIRSLAFANIAGGALGWLALLIAWSSLQPEGRLLLGSASDALIVIGLLELWALSRTAFEAAVE